MSPNAHVDLMLISWLMLKACRDTGRAVYSLTVSSGSEWGTSRDPTVPDGAVIALDLSLHRWWSFLFAEDVAPVARLLALRVFTA